MARMIHTIGIKCAPDKAWAALADVGGLDRMVPQLVARCDYDAESSVRHVTFANGMQLAEPIIAKDAATRTLVWTAQGGEWTHHNASVQVHEHDDDHCKITWTADVLPDEQGAVVDQIMQAGLAAMRETLEQAS